MRVTLLNNLIQISFQYNQALIAKVKGLDNRKYDPKSKSWYIPLANSQGSIKKLMVWGFNIDKELLDTVKQDEDKAKEAEALSVMDDTEFSTSLPLYPFQKVGAAFIHKIGSGLLGDEPGCGKTPTAIAVVEKNKAQKILVFCPAVLKYQWSFELEKFLPGSSVIVVDGSVDNRLKLWRSEARFYIANYELLLRDFDAINSRQWDYIIADECTRITNPRAKQSRAIKKLQSKYRIAMSGTPISNRAQDCWNIVDFCVSGAFGNFWDFINRYCVKNQFGGIFMYQNLDELRSKLKRYMIRRTKEQVLKELPEKIETDIPFVLSEEEKELQTKIKKELLCEIDKVDINKVKNPMMLQFTIAKFARLRQLADSLELLGENKKSTKLEVLRELLEEFKETDQKILIFSEFAEMCKILKRELVEYNPLMIIGETPEKERQKIVEKFNNNPQYKLLTMSSAGMYGLNLQSANVVINYDLPFSISKMEQRVGRVHRIGQKKNVQIFNLLGKGTADMAIRRIIHNKQKLSDQLLGDIPITIDDLRAVAQYEDA